MQRINRHQRHRRGAIWIGNDSAMRWNVIRVDLRDNERDVGLHSECRRIVDHDRAGIARDGRELSGDLAAGAKKCDINFVERSFIEFLNGNRLAAKRDFLADRSRGAECANAGDWKTAPFEYREKLGPNRSSRTNNGNITIFHNAKSERE